jgi:hypothetical protein
MGPLALPAKQTLALGQLIARSALPLELGYCQLQLPPNVRGIPTAGAFVVDRSGAMAAIWRDFAPLAEAGTDAVGRAATTVCDGTATVANKPTARAAAKRLPTRHRS